MKNILFSLCLLAVLAGSPALAREPYLYNGTDPQSQQWRNDPWITTDWAPTPAAAQKLLRQLTAVGVLHDYYRTNWRHGTSTLVVGPGFYRLSGFDQRRVLAIFDQVHQATRTRSGTLFIRDLQSKHVVGLYTRAGLQMQ